MGDAGAGGLPVPPPLLDGCGICLEAPVDVDVYEDRCFACGLRCGRCGLSILAHPSQDCPSSRHLKREWTHAAYDPLRAHYQAPSVHTWPTDQLARLWRIGIPNRHPSLVAALRARIVSSATSLPLRVLFVLFVLQGRLPDLVVHPDPRPRRTRGGVRTQYHLLPFLQWDNGGPQEEEDGYMDRVLPFHHGRRPGHERTLHARSASRDT